MIPHAATALPIATIAPIILAGLITFFVLEKLLVWRHCHAHDCDVHASSGLLLLIGDAVHNFVDGVVIAGAFLDSTPLGLTVAISTVAHEGPLDAGPRPIVDWGCPQLRNDRAKSTNALTSAKVDATPSEIRTAPVLLPSMHRRNSS